MTRRSLKPRRGVALITALLMAVVFLVLIGALMAQMIGELQDVGAHSNSAIALDAAYAGVEDMVLQVEENASGTGHVVPAPINYTYPSPAHAKYSSSVTNTWNTNSGVVYYQINSTGTETNSGQTRSVTALVKSEPYSYFEQFTAGSSGNIYYTTGESFDGPVYNGGSMNIWYQDPSAHPIFNNSVVSLNMPNFYEGVGKTAVSYGAVQWADVASGGSAALKIGTNPMALPTYQSNIADASEAYYGNASHTSALPTPGANGLYMNGGPALSGSGALTTGLYIQGNVKITPSSPGSNNEVWTIAPNGGSTIAATYTVTVDFSAGTTTVAQTTGCPCSSVTYTGTMSGMPQAGSGQPNGAIFVDGNVLLDSGTIHGDYSITVPDYTTDHAHTVTLNGTAPGIVYKDQSSSSTDEFGVWANDIKVTGSNTSTGYEFDGDIFTGYDGECPPCTDGDFSNSAYNNGSVQGTFTFHGGLIQNINGPMGISSGGSLISGFSRKYQYDARLAANPPPGFPVTNRYSIIAWLDEGQ
ncbi:MAG: hypothetical protein JOZ28_07535 [Candidatus Eremiobacteraeota bacterium]|nr:hypothetical protein [Candidatus Eremiobacteraeota bacterium]